MIENLGIKPFIAGVETGTQLRRLAMLEDAAGQEREQRDYAMGKARTNDAVLREVLARASGKKTAADVLNEISAAAQRSPEAAEKAYQFLKSLSPPLRQQLADEALRQKRAEMELDVRKAGLSEEAREKAKFPWWERQENIRYGHDIAKGDASALRSFVNQSELDKLKAGLKPEKPAKSKKTKVLTLQNDMGEQTQFLVDADGEGITLGVRKAGQTDWDFTDEYPRWVLGIDAADRLSSAIGSDERIPSDKKREAAVRMIRDGKVAGYLTDRAAQNQAGKSHAESFLRGALPDQEETFGGVPPGTFSNRATSRPNFTGITQLTMPGFGNRAINDILGRSGTAQPSPALMNNPALEDPYAGLTPPDLESEEGGNGLAKSLWDLWTRKQTDFVSPYLSDY